MASGVQVADVCVTTYQQLKLGKKFKYILFTLNDTLSEIVVDKTSSDASITTTTTTTTTRTSYEGFVEDLPKDQCRWAVYDFDFEKDGNPRNKLCFVLWSPDDAKVKDKMLFASSREALKQRLDGIAFEVQGTDASEISYDAVLTKALTSTH